MKYNGNKIVEELEKENLDGSAFCFICHVVNTPQKKKKRKKKNHLNVTILVKPAK